MLNTGMNYGLGTNDAYANTNVFTGANANTYANTNVFTGTNANVNAKDILASAYTNPMTTCSASGSINVNGAVLPTNYDNDFLMPQELKIGNYLNGQSQVPIPNIGTQAQVGDQFVPSQTPEQVQQGQQSYPQQVTATQVPVQDSQLDGQVTTKTSLKKKGLIAGALAPIAINAYKMFKGTASSVFNKELFVKCPLFAIAGLVLGSIADKFFGNKVAA